MSLPKEPRQKMINLMYLVLTALLALNVSAEILNAFTTVNTSIGQSNNSIDQKNNLIYQQFIKQMSVDPKRVTPLKEAADLVRAHCDSVNAYIDSLKSKIIILSGGYLPNGGIKGEDNLDVPSRVMENQKKGPALKAKLSELRTNLMTVLQQNGFDSSSLSAAFPLKKPEIPKNVNKKTWTEAYFEMVPTIAAVTILSKFQNDIKNSEAEVLDRLFSKINQQEFTFDTYKPLVVPSSYYVMEGEKFQAQVMLGAYSRTVSPLITVNGQPVPVDSGVGTYTTIASGVGPKTLNIALSLKDQSGALKTYTVPLTYVVGASSVSVSADKMNVLYIGVDNPVSVAAAGVPAENVSATISQGSLTKSGPGKYVAKVTTVGNATVNVTAAIEGQQRNMGTMVFRVKRIPDPVAEIGGSKGGLMNSALFRVQKGVSAVLENFDFDARFVVTSYTIGFDGTGFPDYIEKNANSAYFTPEIEQLISRCRPGTRIYVDNIRARGPDGTTRNLPGIAFKLN